ncbi:DNA-binding protein [Jannaschia formosa]|uniref:DNA-binding protein n=1 Tax=Jannaschia formosa TaxID=2259592 RepID=UPI000E1B681A|nr:DNA-binding protein [Jannaschia formosa]TFL16139.1 hypothetical protein DR046_21695 [Jannaschia formosa]
MPTQTDVDDACAQLEGLGQTVSQKSVRAITGGSYTTLGPMIQHWRAAQAEEARLLDVPVPESVAAAADLHLARLWEEAVRAASQEHDSLRHEMKELRSTGEAARAKAEDIIAELEAERDAARAAVAQKVEEL